MRGLSPSLTLTIGELFHVAEIVISAIAIFMVNDRAIIILRTCGSPVRSPALHPNPESAEVAWDAKLSLCATRYGKVIAQVKAIAYHQMGMSVEAFADPLASSWCRRALRDTRKGSPSVSMWRQTNVDWEERLTAVS